MSEPCRIGVVSPHLDDAVLSCGQLLAAHAGSRVVTVFSSGPEAVDPLPFWDQMCAFKPGDNVMAIRQLEDDEAMQRAGATGHRLGFWDGQYRTAPPVRLARLRPGAVRAARAKNDVVALAEAVRSRLHEVVTDLEVDTWLVPLGLHKGDHELVAGACLDLVSALPEKRWVIYEELPYRVENPDTPRELLETLRKERSLDTRPADLAVDPDLSKKQAMVECHRSQLVALRDRVRLAVEGPEVFHEVLRAQALPMT